jgi:gluconolactonase
MAAGLALGCFTALPALARAKASFPSPVPLKRFRVAASGFESPEGIAALPDGRLLFSADGAIIELSRDGSTRTLARTIAPNGIAIDGRGGLLIANMGRLKGLPGPLQRLDLAGSPSITLVAELEGRTLTSTNDLALASDGTVYCTHTGWGAVGNIGAPLAEGFVYRLKPDGSTDVVARGLPSPNGIRLDAGGKWLYVSLTATAQVVRWPVLRDGSLGQREDFGPLLGLVDPAHTVAGLRTMAPAARADLGYCDGMAFDMDGNLWVTLPLANRIIALTPQGQRVDIVHDPEGQLIDFPTNLCWSGRDRRTLNVVSRKGGRIVSARTQRPGLALP